MRKTLALFALFLLAAQPRDDITAALDARVASSPGVAIAVGIISDGKTSTYFAGSSGNSRRLDEHTLFEIGSVTKTFTATALASMVQSHQVRLDDPISKYLPRGVRVPSLDGKTITLLDLAEQRSGLPRLPTNLDEANGDDPYAGYSVADMYAFLNGYTLTRAPGAQYEYSNYGIGLLGQLLANRSKESFETLIASKILGPLAMTDTQFATDSAPDGPPLAAGHDLGGAPVSAWHFQSVMPAGGIRSSLSDMLKYLQCNMGAGPLSATCLFAQTPRAAGTPNHQIGLVWENNDTTGTIAHGGDTFGFHAFIAISKDRRTGVVVLSNGAIVSDIAAHVVQPSFPIAICSRGAGSSDGVYAGEYCNALTGYTFVVAPSSSAERLSIRLVPQTALWYEREAVDTYANAMAGAAIRFVRVNGNVVGLRLSQNGQTVPATRINANGPVVAQLPPPFPNAVALDPATLEEYTGNYSGDGLTFSVTLRGAHVFVQLTGQPAAEVYASAKDAFFYKIVDAQITFVRNASGNVSGLVLHQDGKDVSATRR